MSTDLASLVVNVTGKGIKETTGELKSLETAGKAASAVAEGIQRAFGSAARMVAGYFAAWKMVDLIRDSAMLAARFETLGVSMRIVGANSGYNAAQMEAFSQQLQKTGISMMESRQTLMKMAQAQLDLNEAHKLARIAQDAAVIGNMNSSEAFQRMVYGIQSGQIEILRTIGLNVNFEKGYKTLADQLHKNTQQLTEAEKAQSRMNTVMEQGKLIAGTYEAAMGTAAKQMLSMQRYVEDVKVLFGQTFNEALTVSVMAVTEQFKNLNTELRTASTQEQMKAWGEDMVSIFVAMADALNTVRLSMKSIGAFAGREAMRMDVRDWYSTEMGKIGGGANLDDAAKRAALTQERDRRLAALNQQYEDQTNEIWKEQGMFRRARDERIKLRQEEADRVAMIDRTYGERAKQYYDSLVSGGISPSSANMREKMMGFYEANYPGSMPKDKRPSNTTVTPDKAAADKRKKDLEEYERDRYAMMWDENEKILAMQEDARKKKLDLEKEGIDQATQMREEQFNAYGAFLSAETDLAKEQMRTELDISRQLQDAEDQLRVESLTNEKAKAKEQLRISHEKMVQLIYNSNLTAEAEAEAIERSTKLYEDQLKQLEKSGRRTTDIARELGMTFESAFEAAIVNGQKFGDVLDSLAKDLEKMLVRKYLTEPLFDMVDIGVKAGTDWFSSLISSAKGNVFNTSGLSAYSNSIVTEPTLFRFAKGAGLMGEKGWEAVMPLSRTPSGELGVKGNGGSNVTVNVMESPGNGGKVQQSKGSDGKEIITVLVESIKGALIRDVATQGDFSQALEGRFGLNRAYGSQR